jgi:hypothetical protein
MSSTEISNVANRSLLLFLLSCACFRYSYDNIDVKFLCIVCTELILCAHNVEVTPVWPSASTFYLKKYQFDIDNM